MSSNPLLRQQGYRRLIGASVVLGGANEGAGQIAQALTGVIRRTNRCIQKKFISSLEFKSNYYSNQ